MRWAISGGAGFLGLHLAGGCSPTGTRCGRSTSCRSTTPSSSAGSRSSAATCATRRGARARRRRRRARPRGGGAADPGVARGDPLRQRRRNRGHARGRARSGRAAASCSSRRPRSTASRRCTRSREDAPLVGVGHYGESKIEAERVVPRLRPPRARGRDRAAEDLHRPGAARRLRDPLRLDPRGPPDPGPRRRLEPLPAARGRGPRRRDVPPRASRRRGRDLQRRRDRVRHRALRPRGADRPRRLGAPRLRPVPARPAELALRALELARLSPLAEWHYRTAHRDSFVDVSKARAAPRLRAAPLERAGALARPTTGTWRTAGELRGAGVTHRVPWNQRALGC